MSTHKIDSSDLSFGLNLKRFRKSKGLTQNEFAKKLTITGGFISNIEVGKAMPSKAVINEMIREYRLSLVFLETGKGEMQLPAKQPSQIQTAEPLPNNKNTWPTESDRFKQMCATNFDHVFEYIGEIYGKDSIAIQSFLDDLLKVHHPFNVWLYEKKQARKSSQIMSSENITVNGS